MSTVPFMSHAVAHPVTTFDPLVKVYETFLPPLQLLIACERDVKVLGECYRELSRKHNWSDDIFCGPFLKQLDTCTPVLHSVDSALHETCTSAMRFASDHPVREIIAATLISGIHTLKKEYEGHDWRTVDDPQSLFINLRLEWDSLHKQLQSLWDLLQQEYGESAPRIESLTRLEEQLRQGRAQLLSAASTGTQLLEEKAEREGWATGSS